MSDEEKKEQIKVEDRRHFDSEGNVITSASEQPKPRPEPRPQSAASGGMKVEITSILFSFVHTALIQLGDLEDPVRKGLHPDLEGARHMIEVLECLQQKTKGNLSADEERYLSGALFDLRMRYMQKAKIIR